MDTIPLVNREIETIAQPYAIDVAREGGRIVEVRIAAANGAELDYQTLREATQVLLSKIKRERGTRTDTSSSLDQLRAVHDASGGKLTPEYLAALATAYGAVSNEKSPGEILGRTIGKAVPTVKGHLVKARKLGYLTEVATGSQGGGPTNKALSVLARFLQECANSRE